MSQEEYRFETRPTWNGDFTSEMKSTLNAAAQALNHADIEWGLGGSSLLALYGLADRPPGDLDLLVAENDALRAHEALSQLTPARFSGPKAPFCTRHFYHYELNGTGIDLLGLFGIRHEHGIYLLDWRAAATDPRIALPGSEVPVPLTPLEDWYVLYLLIPGRQSKADAIERYWAAGGSLRQLPLLAALTRELPSEARARIEQVLAGAEAGR